MRSSAVSERHVWKSTAWRSAASRTRRLRPRVRQPTAQDRGRLGQIGRSGTRRARTASTSSSVAEDVATSARCARSRRRGRPARARAARCGSPIARHGLEVGPGDGRDVVRRARAEQVGLGGEVAIDGVALDACPLGDRAERRAGRTDRPVQLDGRLGDPQPRRGHLGGALLQLVLALGFVFVGHHCAINIDRSRGLV